MSDGRFDSWGVVVVLVGGLLFTHMFARSLSRTIFACSICSAFTRETQTQTQHSSVSERKGVGHVILLLYLYRTSLVLLTLFFFLFLLLFSTILFSFLLIFSLNQLNPTQPNTTVVVPLSLCLSTSFFSFSSYHSSPTNPSLPLQSLATPKWLL